MIPAPPGTQLAWALKDSRGVRYLWLEPCRFFVLYNTASLVPMASNGEIARWYDDWMKMGGDDTFVGIVFPDMDDKAIDKAFRDFVTRHDGLDAARDAYLSPPPVKRHPQ